MPATEKPISEKDFLRPHQGGRTTDKGRLVQTFSKLLNDLDKGPLSKELEDQIIAFQKDSNDFLLLPIERQKRLEFVEANAAALVTVMGVHNPEKKEGFIVLKGDKPGPTGAAELARRLDEASLEYTMVEREIGGQKTDIPGHITPVGKFLVAYVSPIQEGFLDKIGANGVGLVVRGAAASQSGVMTVTPPVHPNERGLIVADSKGPILRS